jgi:RNA polymerase-interacting CarD/CdnL/TRCF family regulator
MSEIGRKIRQKKHKKNVISKSNNTKPEKKLDVSQSHDRIAVSLHEAHKMWCNLKDRLKVNPDFVNIPDEDKIVIYQKEFKEFYNEYPIVCRYMICMGQYSHKAMRRYLIKCKNSQLTREQSQDKDYKTDQWVMRRADYVRYLWESYQSQHFSTSEAKQIWQHAYQTLKKEFKDFNDMQQDIEDKLKVDNNVNKAQLVKELVKRLASQDNNQTLKEEDANHLLNLLKTKSYEQRRKNMIMQIKFDVELIKPTRIGIGTKKEAPVEDACDNFNKVQEILSSVKEEKDPTGGLSQLKEVLETAE